MDRLTKTPLVRVGIVTRNRADILPKALESALAQDWPALEVWVVDDASTDNTPGLAEKFPQVKWLRNAGIKGYRDARNRMMQGDGADFFASLDDDSWFLRDDAISTAMREMEARPKLAALAFDILDSSTPEPRGSSPLRATNTYIGCGHLLRLDAVKQAGYYSEVPGAYGVEEKDLSLRLLDHGWDVGLLTGVHVWHDKSMKARDVTYQHQSGVSNDLAFTLQRAPMPSMPFLVAGKILSHAAFVCHFAFRSASRRHSFDRDIAAGHGRLGFLIPYLQGVLSFLRNIPEILQERDPVSAETWSEYQARSRAVVPRIPVRQAETVAVIIPTQNRSAELAKTLRQINLCQPPPDEIIVCCDGCTDDTATMLATEFPDARILSNLTWQGSIPSRDQMIRFAQSDVVVSLDDDSHPMAPDFFNAVLKLFREHPETGVFTFPQVTDEFPETLMQIRPRQGGRVRTGSFTNSGAALRREVYLRQPGYVPFFIHAYEEPDYALQCTAAGFDVVHEPTLTIRHHYSLTGRNERRTHQYHSRNELWSVFIRAPLLLLPVVAPFRVARQFLYSLRRGLGWVLCEPFWWGRALIGIPKCLAARKPISWRGYLRWMNLVRHPDNID